MEANRWLIEVPTGVPRIDYGGLWRWHGTPLAIQLGLGLGTPLAIQESYHIISEHTAQHSTSTAQHSTAQHSTAQHSTAQHSTARYHMRVLLATVSPVSRAAVFLQCLLTDLVRHLLFRPFVLSHSSMPGRA
jgi:hypothetical protein